MINIVLTKVYGQVINVNVDEKGRAKQKRKMKDIINDYLPFMF